MGLKLIGFLLMILLIIVGIIFIFYWLPKKLGYPKIGKYLAFFVTILLLIGILMSIFEDELFSKNDAKKLLEAQNIEVKDEFEILENKSMSGIGDYYHTFTMKISQKDKTRLINEIKNSKNFNLDKETESYFDNREDYYKGPKRIKNYETENLFIRELFEPQGKGYAPIWQKTEIVKSENKLIFEDIDE
jgi:hypothetical protein